MCALAAKAGSTGWISDMRSSCGWACGYVRKCNVAAQHKAAGVLRLWSRFDLWRMDARPGVPHARVANGWGDHDEDEPLRWPQGHRPECRLRLDAADGRIAGSGPRPVESEIQKDHEPRSGARSPRELARAAARRAQGDDPGTEDRDHAGDDHGPGRADAGAGHRRKGDQG